MLRIRSIAAGLAVLLGSAWAVGLPGCAGEYDYGTTGEAQPAERAKTSPPRNADLTAEQKEKLLDSVTELVRERAYAAKVDFTKWPDHLKKHQKAIDDAKNMTQFSNAVNRALNEFGISHIDLLSPRAAEMQHAPKFGGIGITAEQVEDGIKITSVRENEPAAKAGLKQGDVITQVDGVKAELGSIRGEAGTEVTLTVQRADGGKVDEVKIKRAEISTAQPPRLVKVNDEAAVVRLDSFTDLYSRQTVEKVMKEAAGYPYLIIDLRSNGGGSVTNFIHFLSTLLPKGTEVGTFISRQMMENYKNETGAEDLDPVKVAQWSDRKVKINRNPVEPYAGKVAVLINRGSASASEIVAAALRELKEAPLVGDRSAGAVLMSQYVKMENGFEMKVPTSDYVTIKGYRIEGKPLQPDVRSNDGRGGLMAGREPTSDKTVMAALEALKAAAASHAEEKKGEQPVPAGAGGGEMK